MKIIIDTDLLSDNITSIVASSEDADFPVENLQDDFTTNLWKATAVSATLTIAVSKGSAIELLNTNAVSVSAVIGTGGDYELEAGYELETGYELEMSESTTIVSVLPGSHGRLWIDYPVYTVPHIIKLTLTANGENVSAGICRAGNVESFNDPLYGLKESSDDYSIEKDLNNGASYFRKRNVVRTFSGLELIETRANAFLFKMSIFDAVGPKPLAIRLTDLVTDDKFILFAKRTSPPQLTHNLPNYTNVSFELREVI